MENNTSDDVHNFTIFIICEMYELNRLDITMKLQKKKNGKNEQLYVCVMFCSYP